MRKKRKRLKEFFSRISRSRVVRREERAVDEGSENESERKLFDFRISLLRCVNEETNQEWSYGSNLTKFYRQFGRNPPRKEDISKILSNEKKRRKLQRCLELMVKKKFEYVYKKYFTNRLPTKNRMVDELYSKFIGTKTSLEKRSEESKNILDLSDFKEELSGFFELCGILIPNEILCLVLDYLPRNYDVLIGAGRVCKTLYIRLLATWKSIKVTRKNLHQISIMALQNATHIELEYLIKREQLYIYELLNPKKLRSLKLDFGPGSSLEALRIITEFQKKCSVKNKPYAFQNLTEFSTNCVQYNESIILQSVIFPNLSKCKFDTPSPFPSFLRINPFFSSMQGTDQLCVKFGHSSHSLDRALDYVSKFPLSSLRVLKFLGLRAWDTPGILGYNTNRRFPQLIENCEKIEELKVRLEGPVIARNTSRKHHVFNMSKFFEFRSKKCPNLENFSIIQKETELRMKINSKKTPVGKNHLVEVKYFKNSRIKKLEIRSSRTRTQKRTVVDFNLEDMLKEHFFCVQWRNKSVQGRSISHVSNGEDTNRIGNSKSYRSSIGTDERYMDEDGEI